MENKNVSIEEIEHLSKLSRLEFTDAEKESFRTNLASIVDYCSVLENINTEEIESLNINNGQMREDDVEQSLNKIDVVKNAPHHNNTAFIVPRVVE